MLITTCYYGIPLFIRDPLNHFLNTLCHYLFSFNSECYYSSRFLISTCIFAILTAFCLLRLRELCMKTFHCLFRPHIFQVIIHGHLTLRCYVTCAKKGVNKLTSEFISICLFSCCFQTKLCTHF
jgi:hypothetical protein